MFKTKTAFKGYIQNQMFELEEAWIYKEIWSEITRGVFSLFLDDPQALYTLSVISLFNPAGWTKKNWGARGGGGLAVLTIRR